MRRSRSVPRRPVHTVRDLLKQAPLLVPVDAADDGPQVSLIEALDEWQEEDLFLNLRSQVEQLHDLCHTGPRHSAEAGQFRIIANRSIPQQLLKPDGERHQPGGPGNRVVSRLAIEWLSIAEGFVFPPALPEVESVGDLLGAAHTRSSSPAAVIAG